MTVSVSPEVHNLGQLAAGDYLYFAIRGDGMADVKLRFRIIGVVGVKKAMRIPLFVENLSNLESWYIIHHSDPLREHGFSWIFL